MLARKLALTASALALIGAAGCGGDDEDSGDAAATGAAETQTAPPPGDAAATPAATGTTVKVAASDYGKILFDGDDQAIYLFDKEKGSRSECYGECAEAWPPVLTKGDPAPGGDADAAQLGTTMRKDGSVQVTYAGHPLYYYHSDPPGQVLCQNVDEFGGLWLVVQASGQPVTGG